MLACCQIMLAAPTTAASSGSSLQVFMGATRWCELSPTSPALAARRLGTYGGPGAAMPAAEASSGILLAH